MPKSAAPKRDLSKPQDPKLHLKWSGPRVVRSETNRYEDPGIDFSDDPGLTDNSQAADCDVNQIIDRAMRNGGILPGVDIPRVYADVSNAVDYHAALNLINAAHEQFMSLEAKVRAKFKNNPPTSLP